MMIEITNWSVGLFIALVVGHFCVNKFHHYYHCQMNLPKKKDERSSKAFPRAAMGNIERFVFAVAVALSGSSALTAMGGWLALKMAANWQQPGLDGGEALSERGRYLNALAHRRGAILALVSGLLSMFFAYIGGSIASGKAETISVWIVDVIRCVAKTISLRIFS